MNAFSEILRFLDQHTGFVEDLNGLVESSQWPTGWLTSHQISEEVTRFRFWDGLRSRVPEQTRPLLLDHYLREAAKDHASGWVCIDDQFKFRPDSQELSHGKAIDPLSKQNRRHGRVQCEMLTCQFGEVANLSASGVMIKGKGNCSLKVDARTHLDMKCLDHDLKINARVAWLDQDPHAYCMGLEFVDITSDQAQRVRELLPIAAAVQVVSEDPHSGRMTHWGK